MAGKGKKSKESKKVPKRREKVRAANKPEYVTGTGQKLWRVHLKQDCQHRICDIHNPPKGLPESDWPTHWRSDRGLMERICPHGIGHPTKAHMEFLREMDEVRGTENSKWEGIHGCDGCCSGNYQGEGKDRRAPFPEDPPRPLGVCDNDTSLHPQRLEGEQCADLCRNWVLTDSSSDWMNGASDWERGVSWDGLLGSLFDRNPIPKRTSRDLMDDFFSPKEMAGLHMCPPGHCPEPEWIDHDATPNGIGPVCKDCHELIDWDPVDHALGCPWL